MTTAAETMPFLQHLSPEAPTPPASSNATPVAGSTYPSTATLDTRNHDDTPTKTAMAQRHSHASTRRPSAPSTPHPLRLVLLFVRTFALVLSVGLLAIVGSLVGAYGKEDAAAPSRLQYILATVRAYPNVFHRCASPDPRPLERPHDSYDSVPGLPGRRAIRLTL